jgi:uncharacterized heparinase superfamily protein
VIVKTPLILYPAVRQYRHNSGGNQLFHGFDLVETIKIVTALETALKAAEEKLAKQSEYIKTLAGKIAELQKEVTDKQGYIDCILSGGDGK